MSKGKLIVFSGPPCSGKSTLAERLSRELKSAHLQMDEIRTRLIPDSDHREEHRRIAYKAMHLAAELLLEHDRDVIVDATYRQRRHREELEQIAKRVESPLFLIQCVISQEVAALRFSQRGERHPAVDLNERRVAQLASAYPYSRQGLSLHTTQDISSCLEQIKDYLSRAISVGQGEWSQGL